MTFDQFVAARLPGLLRYAVMLTGDRDLAQDVVQEALAKAHVRWRRICAAESPDAYVRRMVLNQYLSWRRSWLHRSVRPAGDQLEAIGDARGASAASADHAASAASADHADRLAEAEDMWMRLATLPRKQRAVLVLRYYEHLDDAEIAALLECAPATVRSNASKALKTLRLGQQRPLDGPPHPAARPSVRVPASVPGSEGNLR